MYIKDRRQRLQLTSHDPVTIPMRTSVSRAVLLAILWWILTDGAMNSWLVGVPVVLFATLVSVKLLPPFTLSLIGLIRFIPFFLWRSLYGGMDVARRALHPGMPISPRMYNHRWRLPPGLSRVFMANTVSLLPGTLSAELDEEFLAVHVLDQTGDFSSDLFILEEYVARLFGLNLIAQRSE